ncbi:MAG: hypothetical protein OXR66_06810 [Candidatus Woesearchaeota archaeon]|nr:hypothetical protein [Candidatus Woesearchaeota archaeon]
MASVTDSIINIILVVSVVVVLGIIVATTVTRSTVNDLQQDKNVFLQERTDIAVDAVLGSTVPAAGYDLAELIGISMFTLKTDVALGSTTVDVVAETRLRMDRVFGNGNYYMTLKPIVKGVNLMFVLDSSPSVAAERATIATNLETLQDTITGLIQRTGEEKVTTQIFMLPTQESSECILFDGLALPDTTCEQLTEETLYSMLLPLGWELPGFAPGQTYATWLSHNFYADSSHFAVSDWAAGTATAALRYQRDAYLQNTVNVNLIFPLSDELATTSIADACFNRGDGQEFFICHICHGDCPVDRSAAAVQQALAHLQGSSVFPIYSFNCDFDYRDGYNQLSGVTSSYIQDFSDTGAPFAPGETWCHQNACPGCSVQGGDFCFHDNCQAKLQEHMQLLADGSGDVINVNDATEIPQRIETAFERATASYDFHLGFKDDKRDRFVFEKIIPLPNGALGEVVLWVYNEQRSCVADEACMTEDECPGIRACTAGELSETCVKTDPSCVGKPCTGEQLCVTADDCLGTRACLSGVLSPVCVKTDPFCEAPCIDSCPMDGIGRCAEVTPGIFAKQLCLPNDRDCLRWELHQQCQQPCQNELLCGEDPSCPHTCILDNICTPECSQDALCFFDPDCPAQCRADCRADGQCNVWCSNNAGCPADPDCPSCMHGPGDQCALSSGILDDPGCCGAEQFVWAQRRLTTCPLTGDEGEVCFGRYSGDPPPFGMCCSGANDCVVMQGGNVQCVAEGTVLTDYLWEGSALCAQNVMERCSPGCSCCPEPISMSTGTVTCNTETGVWS